MTPVRCFLMVAAATVALTACTDMDGTPGRPADGAVIGGSIGAQLDMQEAELSRALAGSGAQVINTGSSIALILPENVTFAFDSFVVNPSFWGPLAAIAQNLARHPNSTVRVVGHTDIIGSAAYNDNLSTQRALAVSRILIGNGLATSRLTYFGQGFRQPVVSNATSAGRALNRRVEIFITPTR